SGQFKPGQSGNAGGRPRTRLLSQELRERMAAGGAQQLADWLWDMARSAKRDTHRLEAIEQIASRGEGKPVTPVFVHEEISEKTARQLIQIASAIKGYLPTLDAEVIEDRKALKDGADG